MTLVLTSFVGSTEQVIDLSTNNILNEKQAYDLKTEILDWNYRFLELWITGITLIFIIFAFFGFRNIREMKQDLTDNLKKEITEEGREIRLENENIIKHQVSLIFKEDVGNIENRLEEVEENINKLELKNEIGKNRK